MTKTPSDENKVQLAVATGGYHAYTQSDSVNPQTGARESRRVIWGRLDENLEFFPGENYWMATPKQREALALPAEWRVADETSTPSASGRRGDDPLDRYYGGVWLLERVAEATGIKDDLEKTFPENRELVDAVLTLAMFGCLSEFDYDRVARWQRIVKTPCSRELTPGAIDELAKTIDEGDRLYFLRRRAAKFGKGGLCVVESTSGTPDGYRPWDPRSGGGRFDLPLPRSTELVVYTLDDHMPIYYRSISQNFPDTSAFKVILKDLEDANFTKVPLISASSSVSLDDIINTPFNNQSFILEVKNNLPQVTEAINSLGQIDINHNSMQMDKGISLLYKQFNLDSNLSILKNETDKNIFQLILYLDYTRRLELIDQIDSDINYQKLSLSNMFDQNLKIENDDEISNQYCYFKLSIDPKTGLLSDYKLDNNKVDKYKNNLGFFALITNDYQLDPIETYKMYSLRDEQHNFYQKMKSRMTDDIMPVFSLVSHSGRLLIQFVSLVFINYIKNVWKKSTLHNLIPSPIEILDEMRSIRFVERTAKDPITTEFVGTQIAICDAFGFQMPVSYSPRLPARPKPRGRVRPVKKP